MVEERRKRKQQKAPKEEGAETTTKKASDVEKLKEDMAEILDEIDSVLEENAEEFLKNYQQKGGE